MRFTESSQKLRRFQGEQQVKYHCKKFQEEHQSYIEKPDEKENSLKKAFNNFQPITYFHGLGLYRNKSLNVDKD
jgi:hypothetical protein